MPFFGAAAFWAAEKEKSYGIFQQRSRRITDPCYRTGSVTDTDGADAGAGILALKITHTSRPSSHAVQHGSSEGYP